jgi:transitional endoplasmic reticulum ATPase
VTDSPSSSPSDASSDADSGPLRRTVAEALPKDEGRGVVRLDPDDLSTMGVHIGDVVGLRAADVESPRQAIAKVLPTHPDRRGQGIVQCDSALRENADTSLGHAVVIQPTETAQAERVVLRPDAGMPSDRDLEGLGRLVDGLPVQPGDCVRATLFGGRRVTLRVESTRPDGPVVIQPSTRVQVEPPRGTDEEEARASTAPVYEDVGGLGDELQRIRETVELPLRRPDLFDRLGIAPPTGILLTGPPGCGKTLLARTIAAETDASFYSISGPEIIRKHYGESEAQLRSLFETATKNAPALVFIDEIDAIAPRREDVEGDVEKRVVATLLTLMDGLEARRHVVVIAATNLPNAIDPALRRAGRFDREIHIPIPDRTGRAEVLAIHSRGMPLADDIDLDQLAAITHGYVGADLEALCREAAMAALRRALPDTGSLLAWTPPESGLVVDRQDFQAALREVQPTATREVFTEIPDVRWEDIGGLQDAKARLTEAVEWPLEYPDLFEKAGVAPPRGVLLAGPPGCGKTLLARAVATETQANFISIKGPELLSKYVGTSEQRVRDVFRKAREAAPCIIFFDEVDALAPVRSDGTSDSGVGARVLTQVLTEIDGIEGLDGVVILGATNRADRIDPALLRPGRFDEIVDIGRPDEEARRAILDVHLRDKPLDTDASALAKDLAQKTDGCSGADLAALCRRAALEAMREVLSESKTNALLITRTHFDAALSATRADIS